MGSRRELNCALLSHEVQGLSLRTSLHLVLGARVGSRASGQGHGLCTLNAFDPVGASVALLGGQRDRRPSEGVFNLGETSKI